MGDPAFSYVDPAHPATITHLRDRSLMHLSRSSPKLKEMSSVAFHPQWLSPWGHLPIILSEHSDGSAASR